MGEVALPGRWAFCLLNWSESPATLSFRLRGRHRIRDVWGDRDMGVHEGGVVSQVLPGHPGRLLACTRET